MQPTMVLLVPFCPNTESEALTFLQKWRQHSTPINVAGYLFSKNGKSNSVKKWNCPYQIKFPIYTFKDLKIHVHVLLFHNINVFYTTNTWLCVEKNLKNLKCDINFDNKTLFDLNNFKICYQKNWKIMTWSLNDYAQWTEIHKI